MGQVNACQIVQLMQAYIFLSSPLFYIVGFALSQIVSLALMMFVMLALPIGFYLQHSIAEMDVEMAIMNQEESVISVMLVVLIALEEEILDVMLVPQDTLTTLEDALINVLRAPFH